MIQEAGQSVSMTVILKPVSVAGHHTAQIGISRGNEDKGVCRHVRLDLQWMLQANPLVKKNLFN